MPYAELHPQQIRCVTEPEPETCSAEEALRGWYDDIRYIDATGAEYAVEAVRLHPLPPLRRLLHGSGLARAEVILRPVARHGLPALKARLLDLLERRPELLRDGQWRAGPEDLEEIRQAGAHAAAIRALGLFAVADPAPAPPGRSPLVEDLR